MSSKKMLRLIIIMAVLLCLTIGGYLLVDYNQKKQEEAELEELASLQLFSFNSDNVSAVSFDTDEGFFRTEIVSGVWTLTESDYPYDLELNTYYINMVCSNMCELTALQKFTVDESRMEVYGLAEPTVVTCYEGSSAYTLLIGNPSATEEYYYVMVPDDDTVYGISFDTGMILRGGTFYLRSRELIPYHESSITEFRLMHGNTPHLVLDKQDGLWHMEEPLPDGNINSATVNSMLTLVTRIDVDFFVTEDQNADLSAYGLNKPDYTLTVKTAEESTELLFAYDPQNNNNMYVLNKGTGLVSSISTNSVGFLNTAPTELMNDTLLSIGFEDTAELDVLVNDLHFTMTMDHENQQYLLDDADVSAIGSSAVNTFKNLFDTMAKMSYESLELDADIPEDAEISCSFSFTRTDGTKTVLTLIQTEDENLYWAFIDDAYTGFTVRRRVLTSNTGVLDFYERMTEAIDQQ